MAQDQQYVLKYINKKNYPFLFAGGLFSLTVLAMIILKLCGGSNESVWMAGAAALLLYLISNAVCSMVVKRLGTYLKRTIVSYLLNLVCLLGVIFLMIGQPYKDSAVYFPVYGALVFCFFVSLSLISLIRKVISMLQES